MIRAAKQLGLLTTPYTFDPDDAVAMAGRAPTCSSPTWA